MELDLVSFIQAKALKNVKFPQGEKYEGRYFYAVKDYTSYISYEGNRLILAGEVLDSTTNEGIDYNYTISAPTFELVKKWFREECNIHIDPIWQWNINKYSLQVDKDEFTGYDTYEEALSEGIDKAIKILKKNGRIC